MTKSRLRAFVAADLPDSVKAEMGKLIEAVDGLQIRGVRTVRPQGVHLTLRFLGDISGDSVSRVSSAMAAAAEGAVHFDLSVSGIGAFPNFMAPRTLWAGVVGDLDKLSMLHGNLQSALESEGFERTGERFSPHITLARVRGRISPEERDRLSSTLEKALYLPIAIPVESISLMQSAPQLGGSVYTPLNTIRLGPGRSIPSA